ncbi:MAG: hypothetical protein JO214_03250 [Frankiaceae bacterium]|nr:hypothetical protein [Frankiaceae bacterium]
MRVDVLGPVALSDADGRVLPVGGPRQQAVLGVLGLLAGTPVPLDALIDAVWAGAPPRTAEHTLHNYVLRLRRAGVAITRVGDAYRLDTPTDAQVMDDARSSGVSVGDALALVRGEPGRGLPDHDLIRSRCAGLMETIDSLREDAAAAALEAADSSAAAGRLVSELRSLATAAPYRERRWELLMLALYRAGRQSDALDAFAQARALLADELGIEPSPSLRRVQQAVLSQDPALGGEAALGRAAAPAGAGGWSLPGVATRLVGREQELRTLHGALAASRLVTLVGPMGSGKTRLALEVAHDQASEVWFVSVEGLAAPTTVTDAVLAVVAPTSRAGDVTAGLLAALAASDGLLVLDGAEQRVGELLELVARLLAGCPKLRLLVTSRHALGARDEAAVPIGSLSALDRRSLLVDRARLAEPSFDLTVADLPAADRLCELLDGLPLGIELVARHLRFLSVAELADRVDADLDRWTAVAGGSGGLIGAVAAEVAALAADEQTLLTCLSVLSAGADLALIQQVAAPSAADDWVFDALASLADRSLVQLRGGPAGVRYAVLLSVRRFLLGLIDEAERQRIERRYVTAVLSRCERLAAELKSANRSAVLTALDADAPHLRAALAAGLDADPAAALRAATGLADYWLARRPAEGLAWLQRLLAVAPVSGAARAEVLLQMGHFAYWLTEFDLGTKLLAEARELLSAATEPVLLGRVLRRMGAIAAASDDVARANLLLSESAAVLAASGAEVEEAVSLLHLGSLLADENRPAEALPLLARARDALRTAGDPLQEAHALGALTLAWWKAGDLLAAKGAGDRALERFRSLGHRPSEGVVAYRLASVTRALGDLPGSREYVDIALESGRETGTRTTLALAQLAAARLDLDAGELGQAATAVKAALASLDVTTDRWVLVEGLEVAGRLEAMRGRSAARLLDRAAELREEIGQPAPPPDADEIAKLRSGLAPGEAATTSAPDVSDTAALRAWALDVCSAAGPGDARSPAPVG